MSEPIPETSPTAYPSGPAVWTLFCAVIDNHGDMGVCWRLARQLVAEYDFAVTLWIDDIQALSRFLGMEDTFPTETLWRDGVCVRRWSSPWQQTLATDTLIAGSAVIIEAFACELPEAVIAALGRVRRPPLWINLEYLSAESWVSGCHGLQSLHTPGEVSEKEGRESGLPAMLAKTFFFPGFVAGTGGLLRERGLLQRHFGWQSTEKACRAQLLSDRGVNWQPDLLEALWISV